MDKTLEDVRTYKKIFELSPEFILLIDTKGDIVDKNDKGEQWLGYKSEDSVGKNILELPYLSEKGKIKIKEMFTRRVRGESITPYEADFIAKDGKRKVGRIFATPIKDENNKIIGVLAMVSDITEHKLIDESLAESEEKWRSLIENAPNAIITVDKEGIIKFLNRGKLGVDLKQYLEKSVYEFIFPADRTIVKKAIERACRTGKPGKCFARASNIKGNGIAWYDVQLGPVNHNGKTCAVMLIAVDITESKEMELLLKESEEKLSTQNIILKEKNIAAAEIARQLKKEKLRVADQLQTSLERLVMPLLKKTRGKNSKIEKVYIALLADSLKSLIEPFGKNFSVEISGLAKRETEICDMIKKGLNSKEIAQTLNISRRTVGLERYNIRKKLGLTNKKINLSVYLDNL